MKLFIIFLKKKIKQQNEVPHNKMEYSAMNESKQMKNQMTNIIQKMKKIMNFKINLIDCLKKICKIRLMKVKMIGLKMKIHNTIYLILIILKLT